MIKPALIAGMLIGAPAFFLSTPACAEDTMPVTLSLFWQDADSPFSAKPTPDDTQYIPNVMEWDVSAYMTSLTVKQQDGTRRIVRLQRNGYEVYDIKTKDE